MHGIPPDRHLPLTPTQPLTRSGNYRATYLSHPLLVSVHLPKRKTDGVDAGNLLVSLSEVQKADYLALG